MKYEMFTKRKVLFILWAAGMLHIVCILESYLTCGTCQNWVTQNCTQGFAGPCIQPGSRTAAVTRHIVMNALFDIAPKYFVRVI